MAYLPPGGAANPDGTYPEGAFDELPAVPPKGRHQGSDRNLVSNVLAAFVVVALPIAVVAVLGVPRLEPPTRWPDAEDLVAAGTLPGGLILNLMVLILALSWIGALTLLVAYVVSRTEGRPDRSGRQSRRDRPDKEPRHRGRKQMEQTKDEAEDEAEEPWYRQSPPLFTEPIADVERIEPPGDTEPAGAPTAGVPTAGVPTAGVPTAGVPTAGVPTAGVPSGAVEPFGGYSLSSPPPASEDPMAPLDADPMAPAGEHPMPPADADQLMPLPMPAQGAGVARMDEPPEIVPIRAYYVARSADTLRSVAAQFLNSPARWEEVRSLNAAYPGIAGLGPDDLITEGSALMLPGDPMPWGKPDPVYLWTLAERFLFTAWGREPAPSEVVPFWKGLAVGMEIDEEALGDLGETGGAAALAPAAEPPPDTPVLSDQPPAAGIPMPQAPAEAEPITETQDQTDQPAAYEPVAYEPGEAELTGAPAQDPTAPAAPAAPELLPTADPSPPYEAPAPEPPPAEPPAAYAPPAPEPPATYTPPTPEPPPAYAPPAPEPPATYTPPTPEPPPTYTPPTPEPPPAYTPPAPEPPPAYTPPAPEPPATYAPPAPEPPPTYTPPIPEPPPVEPPATYQPPTPEPPATYTPPAPEPPPAYAPPEPGFQEPYAEQEAPPLPQFMPSVTGPDISPQQQAGGLDVTRRSLAGTAIGDAMLLWRLSRMRQRRGVQAQGPDPLVESLERNARLDSLRLIEAAMRQLRAATVAQFKDKPKVMAVRVGTYGFEVLLDEPAAAPEGWRSASGGYVLELNEGVTLEQLDASGHGLSLCPALVPVGDTVEGPLLLNIEEIGCLMVSGTNIASANLLVAIVEALGSSPMASNVRVVTVGVNAPVGPGWERILATSFDSPQLEQLLINASNPTMASPGLDVLVVGPGHDILVQRAGQIASSPNSNLALVGATSSATARWPWQIHVDDASRAIVQPIACTMAAARAMSPELAASLSAEAADLNPLSGF